VPQTISKLSGSRASTILAGRMVFLTPEELLEVLKLARERNTRDHAMILLAYRRVEGQ